MTSPRILSKVVDLEHERQHRLGLPSVRLLFAALTAFGALHGGAPPSHGGCPPDCPPRPWWNDQRVADTTATDWMAQLPDDLLISELSIPGTHESHSFDGPGPPVLTPWCAICQTTPFHMQLKAGIRAFDIRIRHYDNLLGIYHSQIFQSANFTEGCWNNDCGCGGVLFACVQFLQEHPGETVLLRLKPNCGDDAALGNFYCDGDSLSFSEAIEAALAMYPDYVYEWPVDDCEAMPTLGEVRGKIVILQDFVGDYHVGYEASFMGYQGLSFDRVSCVGSDSDGPDLTVLSQGNGADGQCMPFYNNGDGTLTCPSALNAPYETTSLCSGDFDSNGYSDFASATAEGLYVYLYDSSGLLSSTRYSYFMHQTLLSLAAADFDNDGDLDIVVVDVTWGSNSGVRMYRNNGDGTFTPDGGYSWFFGVQSVAVANLNGDGRADLVTVSGGAVEAWTFDEGATTPIQYGNWVGAHASRVAVADFNGDGYDDVVAIRSYGFYRCQNDYPNGLVELDPLVYAGGNLVAVTAADVDSDGDQDVILSDFGDSKIRVYLNDGAFGFPHSYTIPVGTRLPVGVSTADVDGDLDVDLAVTEWGPGNESWGLDREYILRNMDDGANWCPGKALGPYWNYLTIQDFYAIRGWGEDGGVQTKVDLIHQYIDWARDSATTHPESLFVNFLSGLDWRDPETDCRIQPKEVAYTTNLATHSYLWGALNAGEVWRCGILMADFPGDGLIDDIIGHNRFGRFEHMDYELPEMAKGSVAWGDYDNDGDLDILLTGEAEGANPPYARVYRNDAGSFVDINAGLVGVTHGDGAWGDYDNDGDLDIALTGDTGADSVTIVYRNEAGSYVPIADLPGVVNSDVAWGDYDNDNDLDLLLTGEGGGHCWASVFRNDPDGFHEIVPSGLPGVTDGQGAWGDFDNDGDLDIALTGYAPDSGHGISRVYENDAGTFSWVGLDLPGLSVSSVAWGDYDNDTYLDLVLAGDTGTGYVTKVCRNVFGIGLFLDIGAAIKGVGHGAVAWGDYDLDGYLDLMVTGASWAAYTDTMYVSQLYRNNGGEFGRQLSWFIPVEHSAVAWGDYDADGDPDIVLAGEFGGGYGYRSVVYRNTRLAHPSPSTAGTVPAQNALDVPVYTDVSVTFDVDMYAGSINASTFVVNGMCSGSHSGAILYDQGSKTATFDPAVDFAVGEIVTVVLTDMRSAVGMPLADYVWSFTTAAQGGSGAFPEHVIYVIGHTDAAVFASDLDGDTDLDLVTANSSCDLLCGVSVLLNQGNGFAPAASYTTGNKPWAVFASDLDGDGDTDLATAGDPSWQGDLAILLNAGDGTFPSSAGYIIGGGYALRSVFGADVDSDGDVDLAVASQSDDRVWILVNQGNGTFPDLRSYAAGNDPSSVFGSDLDGDGDVDLAVANESSDDVSILLNEGGGTFVMQSTCVVGDAPRSVFGADLDGDGDIDLATANSLTPDVSVLLNEGGGTFAAQVKYTAAGPTLGPYSLFASDLDGDGDLDLATGNYPSNTISVLRNLGDGTFAPQLTYDAFGGASIFAVDLDGDEDVDLATASLIGLVSVLMNNEAVGVELPETALIPVQYALRRNAPNPFGAVTKIGFDLPSAGGVRLEVYDVSGRCIRTLVNEEMDPGRYSMTWDGRNSSGRVVADGVYFVRLKAGSFTATQKLVRLR